MDDERVFRCYAEGLAEEALGQLGVVGEAVLQADVEHGEMTPDGERKATSVTQRAAGDLPRALTVLLQGSCTISKVKCNAF